MKHTLIDIAAAAGHLRLSYEDELYTASIGNGAESAAIVVPADQVPAEDGRFALHYDAAIFALFYNGTLLGSAANPPLPTGLAASMYWGCDGAGNQWDDVVGPVRLSSVARTAAELRAAWGKPLGLDADTHALLAIPAQSEALLLRPNGQSATIAVDPLRPAPREHELPQLRETDSAGGIYVYGRALRRLRRNLDFPVISDAELARLRPFFEVTVTGIRRRFTWIDHAGTTRTVRWLEPRLRHKPTGPGRHRAEIGIEEEIGL